MARKASAAGALAEHDRLAVVAAGGHGRLERDLTEQRHAGVGGQLGAAALAEEAVGRRRARR